MKMAWRIIFILVTCVASFSDGDKLFPKPSLTENRSARVLKLDCKPPEDTTSWQDVYDIRVFVCLRAPHFDTCVNHTVASITNRNKKPKRGSVLPSIAKVTFSGSWMPAGSPTLTVETPFSSQNYGVYYCTSEYGSSEGIRKYSAGISVDDSSDTRRSPLKRDRFEVQIIKAHAVNVTWRPPDDSEFLEGRVTRSFVDREEKVTTFPRPLFIATATRDFVYDNAGVLLTEFEPPSSTGPNYTVSVYVGSQKCTPFCRYSCSVPYHACWGEAAHFCECSHGENVVSTTASIESSEKSVTATTKSAYYSVTASSGLSKGGVGGVICLAVLIVVFAVSVIVLVILLRRGKLPRIKTLLNAPTVNKKMNTCIETKDSDTQTENVEPTDNQRIQEPRVTHGHKLTVDHQPRKLSENKSKGRQGQSYSSDEQNTQDLHQKDEGSNRREEDRRRRQINERPKYPLDDAPLPEEPGEDGASGGDRQPLLAPKPAHDNNPAGTKKKSELHSSKEQAAHSSRNSGSGGARYKDTHQNLDASFSSQPVTNTSRAGDRSPLSPSTARHFDDSNPIQDQVNTSEQHQTKTELGHGTGEEHIPENDFVVSPSSGSALSLRSQTNDTEKPPKSVTEGSHSNSKEVP